MNCRGDPNEGAKVDFAACVNGPDSLTRSRLVRRKMRIWGDSFCKMRPNFIQKPELSGIFAWHIFSNQGLNGNRAHNKST
jgi:hypothetical protein